MNCFRKCSEQRVPVRRTRVENVGQDGHHAELVLLTRLLGDVLTDNLGPGRQGRRQSLSTITSITGQSGSLPGHFLLLPSLHQPRLRGSVTGPQPYLGVLRTRTHTL